MMKSRAKNFYPSQSPCRYLILARLEVEGPLPALAFRTSREPFCGCHPANILDSLVDEGYLSKHGGRYHILESGRREVLPGTNHGKKNHQKMMHRAAEVFQLFFPYYHAKFDTGRLDKKGRGHHPDLLLTEVQSSRYWDRSAQYGYEAEVDVDERNVVENYRGNVNEELPSVFQPFNHADVDEIIQILESEGADVRIGIDEVPAHILRRKPHEPEVAIVLQGFKHPEGETVEDEVVRRGIEALEEGNDLGLNEKESGLYLYSYDSDNQKTSYIGPADSLAAKLARGEVGPDRAERRLQERKEGRGSPYGGERPWGYRRERKLLRFRSRLDSSLPLKKRLNKFVRDPEQIPLPEDCPPAESIDWENVRMEYIVNPEVSFVRPIEKARTQFMTGEIDLNSAVEKIKEGLGLEKI